MAIETVKTSGTGDAASLRGLARGGVFLPGDDGFEAARTTWSLAEDLHPAAVAYPEDVTEVAALVRAAAAAGLRVAPLGTGHNAHPLRDLSHSLLIRTPRMNAVAIDPVNRRARVEAGVVWADVVDQAAEHGLAALHGSSPDTGVVGYTLGGGLSWYGRSHGLAASSVTAIELVTADGSLVRADAETETDLFWALRGGGGANFGVVTALEFTLYPIETAYAGLMVWDWKDAREVLTRWSQWALEAPDSITTSYRHLRYPPIPQIPEPFRGRNLVMIDGVATGPDSEAEQILAPLRELGPELDTFTRVPAATLTRLHMDPEEPTPGIGGSVLLTELPTAAVDAFIETAGPGSGTSLFVAELRQLGGALARPHPDGGALDHFDGQFIALAGGLAISPETLAQTMTDGDRLFGALAPYTGRPYLNLVNAQIDPATGFGPETWDALRRIRRAHDPENLFQANHEISTTS
jgi:FAD/FMN-containing dehydrogenase